MAALNLKPAAVLNNTVAGLHPDTTGMFVFTCDAGLKPQPASLSVELLKMADAAGLVPDIDGNGKATVRTPA